MFFHVKKEVLAISAVHNVLLLHTGWLWWDLNRKSLRTVHLYSCIYFFIVSSCMGVEGLSVLSTEKMLILWSLQLYYTNLFKPFLALNPLRGAIRWKSKVTHTLQSYKHGQKTRNVDGRGGLHVEKFNQFKVMKREEWWNEKKWASAEWITWITSIRITTAKQQLETESWSQTIETPENIHGPRGWNTHQSFHL